MLNKTVQAEATQNPAVLSPPCLLRKVLIHLVYLTDVPKHT